MSTVKCRLIDRTGVIQQNLTNVKWAWFDQTIPNNYVTPTDSGTNGTTDVDGYIEITLTGTSLVAGQLGCLALSTSDNVDLGLYKLVVRA